MKILVTGDYDPRYNRTQILLKGLKSMGSVEITEYPISTLKNLDKQAFRDLARNVDVIYLPPFTHKSVNKLWKLTDKPIVFDPLISKYLTKVFDYKEVSRFSPRAFKNYLKDRIAMNRSDLIIADTQAHKEYFRSQFKINPDKIKVLPIGVDIKQFKPIDRPPNPVFNVGFYGGFIPLQGTQYMIRAAELLQKQIDIQFTLIGTGFEWEKMKKLAKSLNLNNVNFLGWVPYEELSDRINQFDVCLGIFGDTLKADLVIPNKVFHYAALRKCIITKETPAIKEVFTNQENILLTCNNPEEIAEQILRLKKDSDFTNRIAAASQQLVIQKYNSHKIAEQFISYLKEYQDE